MAELILPLSPDLALRDRLRREAIRASSIRHPGLVPVREVTLVQAGLHLVYDDARDSVPLSEVDTAALRDGPDAVEGIALLASIAAGLAHLHDAGLAHGAVALAHVRRRDDGTGVLGGWRPGGVVAEDVLALARMIDAVVPAASVHSDVAQLLIAASDEDASLRPSMARVAAVLDVARRRPPISPPARRLGESPDPLVLLRSSGRPRPEAGSDEPAEPRGVAGGRTAGRSPRGSSRASAGSQTPLPTGQRARHAANRPRRGEAAPLSGLAGRWRWLVLAAGVGVLGFMGFGAVSAADGTPEPASVPSAVAMPVPVAVPSPTVASTARASGRSRGRSAPVERASAAASKGVTACPVTAEPKAKAEQKATAEQKAKAKAEARPDPSFASRYRP